MFSKLAFLGATALIIGAVSAPASAQISPGRMLDPAVRSDSAHIQQVTTKKKRTAKRSKSNVRNKSYSWQNVRGSTSPAYLPNRRGMR